MFKLCSLRKVRDDHPTMLYNGTVMDQFESERDQQLRVFVSHRLQPVNKDRSEFQFLRTVVYITIKI